MNTGNSLADLLERRTADQPESVPYTFLDGDTQTSASYREMDARARRIAVALRAYCSRGDRAVLVLPPGLDYVAAFFGCLYAGVIAVPVYPPHGGSLSRSVARLAAIVADATPTVALTLGAIAEQSEHLTKDAPALKTLRWLGVDTLTDIDSEWQREPTRREDLAFLQYTSGSTATPKGVMVSHGNLLSNGADIERFFGFTPDSKTVIWLPPYHDMGLIGGILQPLYSGYPTVLMSPVEFARTPLRWLRAIAEHRATCSGGPNFAYELCVRKITPADLAGMDLSCWQLAFNGAEPIRPDVLRLFSELLAPTGFRHESFYPCYGLAEATLIATGGKRADAPVVLPADPASGRSQPLVGCGTAAPGQRLAIVDPSDGTLCPDGEVGEIWLAGPSVADGYWGRPELTEEVFRARAAGADESFLRTGDLGFQRDGELYVTGRIKDLIIQRGVNHYPQDIEYTAFRAHPAMRHNGGACFTIPVDGAERLVVAHEVTEEVDPGEVAAAVRAAVGQQHMLSTYAVVLVDRGRLPRTSSGKVQRHAARAGYLDGTLDVVGSQVFADSDEYDDAAELALNESVEGFVRTVIARHLASRPAALDLSLSGPALGLDSIAILEVHQEIEARFQLELPADTLLNGSVAAFVDAVVVAQTNPVRSPQAPVPATDELSHGQRGLWFLDRMTGCGAAYNISAALRLPAGLDTDRLAAALDSVVERHAALRTTFPVEDGQPKRRVDPIGRVTLDRETLADGSPAVLSALAAEPFDLADGPLMRAYLSNQDSPVLLLVVHHIIADFLSMAVLADELIRHFQAGGRAPLPPAGDYGEHVWTQRQYLASDVGKASAAYWKRQLAGDLPVLELPTDRPRPPRQTFRGDGVAFDLDVELYTGLRGLAKSAGTTPHTLLLCAFEVLLHRYTGQTDILVATPTFGRTRRSFTNTVGYFVNPVVVRGDLAGDPTFTELLARFAGTVRDGFAHQDFPFGLLGEVTRLARDASRSPIFQAMFIHHQSPASFPDELGLVAIGRAVDEFAIAGTPVTPVPVAQHTAQFDLTVAVAENEGALAGTVRFNADLFDRATIADLADNFVTLLWEILADADRRIGVLPLLSASKRHRMIAEWNDTKRLLPPEILVHEALDRMAETCPDNVAVAFRSATMTYGELADRAGRLARYLTGLGVGPESHVGVCVDRSPELVVALLGILKAGGAYVPLDPDHPRERVEVIVTDARIDVLVARRPTVAGLPDTDAVVVDLDEVLAHDQSDTVALTVHADNAAYVLYTSGSSGVPKGVVVSHRNVANFFAAMDERVGCGPRDTMLAVTNVGFDISVLELLWTLTRGAKVVLAEDTAVGRAGSVPARKRHLDFSLFYFASADSAAGAAGEQYRLVFDGARFADRHGFAAVWTPERHFHEFGGLYPNPSVLSAAIAAVTENIAVRAGSVVLPLHSPVRVAEEWSLVDNISGGRAGVAFASGWHADDFVFFPDHYADRKDRTFAGIETVHRLWRGEGVSLPGGSGQSVDVRIHPTPVQPTLPTWITAAGTPDTFTRAGAIGANVLTHLLGQSIEQVAENIRRYRQARLEHGHDPDAGTVTLMMHTYIGADIDEVRALVREPFTEYLRSSVGLIENLVRSLRLPVDLAGMSHADREDLLAFAVDRYFETSALFGTPESVQPLVGRCADAGVDEIACLVDFGLPADVALAGLPNLDLVRVKATKVTGEQPHSLAAQVAAHRPTLLQATPSMMQVIALDEPAMAGLGSLRALLLGGEALPPALAGTLRAALPARIMNMYGPTETTVWSATHHVDTVDGPVPLGTPIANTQIYVVGPDLRPLPAGVPGELVIGGLGVSRGYWRRPDLTAEKFVPDPFGDQPGARLYRTGDLARRRADGVLEFLGRIDRQVKVRGVRIELGDIEAALCRRDDVREAAVIAQTGVTDDVRLVGYVVPANGAGPTTGQLRDGLAECLPQTMIPAAFVLLPELPHTVNGKVDVKSLAAVEWSVTGHGTQAPPVTDLERGIADVWSEVLRVDSVGLYDNFFDLGGHSMLMVQAHAQLRGLVGDLPLIKLLEHPTVSALAAYLSGDQATTTFSDSQERARKQRDSRRKRRGHGGRKDA